MTGSSLSGDYIKINVQLTRDGIPIIYPSYFIQYHNLEISLCQLKYDALANLGMISNLFNSDGAPILESVDIIDWKDRVSNSIFALRTVLAAMPAQINLNLHLLYPTESEDANLGIHPDIDINTFADAILTEVFDHARALRAQSPDLTRSIVFSSFNPNICTAVNWKQPNYPVLLCNDLGSLRRTLQPSNSISEMPTERGTSLKETARLAQTNNFMGLTCSARILQMVPALTETIKQAGLVLVSDASEEEGSIPQQATSGVTGPTFAMIDGVSGVMKANGILRFNETVDM
jgi:CDK inhibitor PHO81